MSLLLFAITSILGLMLLSLAFVLLLAELLGGVVLPLLIVGGALLIVALFIYVYEIRSDVVRWRQRLDTIYDVSAMMESMASRVATFVKKILG